MTAPASYAQEGMWLLEQLTGDPVINCIPMGWRVDGPLDVAAFTAAVRLVAARNPALLSLCAWDEHGGTLRTHEPFRPDDVPVRHTRSGDAQAALAELYDEALRPWPDGVPLFRVHVWTTPGEAYVLMVLSHLIFDGGSEDSFFDEIALAYDHLTTGAAMPEAPPRFSRFAVEQRERFATADEVARVERAAAELPVPQLAQLPSSLPGHVRVDPAEGIRHYAWIPTPLLRRLRQVGRAHGASDAIVVLAGFMATVARLGGQETCSVLLPYVNRAARWTQTVIGPCLNSLFVTAPVDPSASFGRFLDGVRDACFATYAAHDVPAEALQAQWARGEAEPRCNLMLNVFSQDRTALHLPGCTTRWLTREQVPVRVRADLCVYGWPDDKGLRLEFLYRLASFGAADIASFADSMTALLATVADDPDARIDAVPLDGAERTRRALGQPMTASAYPSVVHEVWDAAARWPDRVAVASPAGDWTYAQLCAAADRVAGRLLDLGLRRADVVSVQGGHDRRLVATALGVLRAGGVLMLVGADVPAARREAIYATARPALVVGAGTGVAAGFEDLLAEGPGAGDAPDLGARDPAYLFFTSGSTGAPKAVLGCHGGLGHFLAWERGLLDAAPGDRVAWRTNLEFDVVLRDLFLPLVSGATLVVPDAADLGDPASLLRWLDRESVTLLHITPSLADVLLAERSEQPEASTRPRGLRAVLFAGEPLTAHTVDRWRAGMGAETRLINLYGPTETTLAKCGYEVPAAPAPGVQPVGSPQPETQVVILTAAGRPAGIGEPGEICIRTPHRTLGYLGAPDADAARFQPNPYRQDPDDLLYRTGDLGRIRADGLVDILGRTDDELKIHGVRIQPAEVAAALRSHPDVDRALAVKRADGHGLVAYVVPRPGARPPEQAVLRWAAGQLPAAAVPSQLITVDSLPLLPNGKVDRAALPQPASRPTGAAVVAPRDAREAAVVDAFREVLDLSGLGVHDEFLALGGHSLLAMRVASRLQQRLGVRVPAAAVLDRATPAAIAAWIGTQDADSPDPAAGRRHHADEPYPAGYAQQRMFFLEQLTGGEPGVYTIPWCFRLAGPLDAAALERALVRLVERHAPLRTGFEVTPDGLVARPKPAREVFEWRTVELPGPENLVGWVQAETQRPLDLPAGRCLRATLATLGPDDHALLLAVHHIAADGWSLAVTQSELSTLYRAELGDAGGAPEPAPLPGEYADFAAWQRVRVAALESDGTLARVAAHLRGAPQQYGMPTDRPRGPYQTYRGARVTVDLPGELAARLRTAAARRAVTPFALVCAAFVATLARRGGDTDLVLGTAVANRPGPGYEHLVGCFINTVPMRVALPGSGLLDDLVTTVAAEAARALRHADVPFERLLTELDVPRTLNTSPLFQAMLVMRQAEPANLDLRGVRVSPVPDLRLTAKTDLSLVAGLDGARPELALEYNTDLFEAATVERMLDHILYLLARIAPDRIAGGATAARYDELPPAQLAEELAAAAGPRRPHHAAEPVDLMAAIRRTAARTPDAPAVSDERRTLSYAQLVAFADAYAARLADLGVRPGDTVAVRLERSVELVVALVAVLAAGAAYLPLDTDAPPERAELMLATAAATVVITTTTAGPAPAHFPGKCRVEGPRLDTFLESARGGDVPVGGGAYCIFTSGSTGVPKGVLVPHPAIVNRLRWMQEAYRLDATDTVLQKTPYTFDVSVWEFFWPLLAGARLVVARPGGHRDPGYLLDLIRRERVTVVHFVPAMLATLLEQPGAGAMMSGVRLVVCSGEALEAGLRDRFYEVVGAGPRLENLYGPTEAAVDVSRYACRPGDGPVVPIGQPIDNIEMYVLDRHLRPVPRGGVGELYLGGVGLATGYIGRADLTADRFVPHPFGGPPAGPTGVAGAGPTGGARLYRTGDLARRRNGGDIEYLGRTDFQVKLRGVRIELGEIEERLAAQPEVADAVATVRTRADGGRELVAYAVLRPGARIDQQALLDRLRTFLPDAMCPALIMFLPELPLGVAGKVDRSALPDPEPARPRAATHEPPVTEQERTLAEIWGDVLKLDSPVGALDGFFAMGGDSLSAIRMLGAVSDRGWSLSLNDVFTARTLRDLAAALRPTDPTDPTNPTDPDHPTDVGRSTRAEQDRPRVDRPTSTPGDLLSDADRALLADLIGGEPDPHRRKQP